MTSLELLRQSAAELADAGIESAAVDAEIILSELLGCGRANLISRYHDPLSSEITARAQEIVARRLKREPLQYILGHAWFMELELEVSPAVLIPRPETELLVEKIRQAAPQNADVLDVGVGSGAIALAVAYARADIRVIAVDCSRAALAVAGRNRRKYGLENVELLESNLFEQLTGRRFDLIAANLPYITEAEYSSLQPEVKDYEPKLALTAPENGLAVIKRCISDCPAYLHRGGMIIFELGETQAPAAEQMLAETCAFSNIETMQDYHHRDRFVSAISK